MTVALLVVAALALGLVALWALFGWLGAWRLNRPQPEIPTVDYGFTPWELAVEHEPAAFTAADGVALSGWFLPRPGRSVIIVLHGYRGNKSQVLGVSSALWRAGFSVLLFDFRGRGASAPAPISMGAWEVADLAAALDWVADRVPGAVVGLLGYSMGGVVALQGGVDPRVRAIVADSAFTSQRAVLEHVIARDFGRYLGGSGGRRLVPSIEWWHRRRGKPPFDAIAPAATLDRLRGTPLLFIHGTEDALVPLALAEALDAAAPPPKTSWFVAGAGHCGAYFVDRTAYCDRVADFFAAALAPRAI